MNPEKTAILNELKNKYNSLKMICQKRGIDFIWYFIGDGKERSVIEERINSLGLQDSIIITGFTDNPFCLMKE